jgi:hypothetical protein
MTTLFYKGVGVGTHHYPTDLRTSGIMARTASALNVVAAEQHIARGTTTSPCISLTKSYGVAHDYAMNASRARPTRAVPSYVYEVQVPAKPGIQIIDPIAYIASHHANPLMSPSYHHDGDQSFLGIVAYPLAAGGSLGVALRPPGMGGGGPRPPNLTIQLEALVFAIRDAEILVHGNIPSSWIINRHDVF